MDNGPRKSKLGLVISLIIAVLVVVGAVMWAMNSSRQQQAASVQPGSSGTAEVDDGGSNKAISQAELAAADGKDGNECYVAVDGVVYEIKDSSLWQNGQHTPSNGQGYCGADMSAAINQSPHGKSKLEQLKEVGRLE
jgi:predicted heme/steroid binding protein